MDVVPRVEQFICLFERLVVRSLLVLVYMPMFPWAEILNPKLLSAALSSECECVWLLNRKHLVSKSIKKFLSEQVNNRCSTKCFDCFWVEKHGGKNRAFAMIQKIITWCHYLLDVITVKGGSISYLIMECTESIFYMTVLVNKLILLANGLSKCINKLNK